MSTESKPRERAMYVAPQIDKIWLLNEQRKLYARSMENPDYAFQKLWGLITDPRNLGIALERVARNRGRRTAGVDGITVRMMMRDGVHVFVEELRKDLRAGAYQPSPVRRVLIPKASQPGKTRPLGIPTVKDRVVQAAVKNILEPIFEADFYPTSFGFRPGRSVAFALEQLKRLMRPASSRKKEHADRIPYQWAIEGDIKACFDNIEHHELMNRVRRRIIDSKVNRLIVAFLRAGILSESQFFRSESGTPQGGILSPLLANIALGVIDERYERHVWPRRTPTLLTTEREIMVRAADRRYTDRGRHAVCVPIRYADDFIILVGTPYRPGQYERTGEVANREKTELAGLLKGRLNLELSAAKTLVTPVTSRMRFLGHHVFVRNHPTHGRLVSTTVVPRDRSQRLRCIIKQLFRRFTKKSTLDDRLKLLNPILRGWANFYRHAWGAKRVFARLDNYVWWTIYRWLRKKHERVAMFRIIAKYGYRKPGLGAVLWRGRELRCYRMAETKVRRFRLSWVKRPAFASTSMESPVHNERCTPGSEKGARKPARVTS